MLWSPARVREIDSRSADNPMAPRIFVIAPQHTVCKRSQHRATGRFENDTTSRILENADAVFD